VVESRRNGEDFGLERLKKHLQHTTASSAKELGLSVLDSVQQFMCTPPTHDDVTALTLVRAVSAKVASA